VGSLPRLDVFEHTHSWSFAQLENMHEYIMRVVVYLLNHDRGMQHTRHQLSACIIPHSPRAAKRTLLACKFLLTFKNKMLSCRRQSCDTRTRTFTVQMYAFFLPFKCADN
jgi:hypothetical protein